MTDWNERYADEAYVFGTEPNAFLTREIGRLEKSSRVLAVADGEGRNGVFLAGEGHSVMAVDASRTGLEKARRLALEQGVGLDFVEADLMTWSWPEAAFDAVVAIFIQFAGPAERAVLFDGMKKTLKPGGLLLLEGYRPEQVDFGTGGPPNRENMYTRTLLEEAFEEFDLLLLDEYDAEINEGYGHVGRSALIDLVARKPMP